MKLIHCLLLNHSSIDTINFLNRNVKATPKVLSAKCFNGITTIIGHLIFKYFDALNGALFLWRKETMCKKTTVRLSSTIPQLLVARRSFRAFLNFIFQILLLKKRLDLITLIIVVSRCIKP